MIPQHSSATNEHPTPPEVVEAARALLGHFDLDPASCPEFNERIRATKIYTREDNGLLQPWHGRVFLNPPGGCVRLIDGQWIPTKGGGRAVSSMWVWWDHLTKQWASGAVERAFFVGFTLEILRLSQRGLFPVQMFPRCYPRDRLPFKGDDPTHANVLVYLPPRGVHARGEMREHFAGIGLCEGGAIL